MNSDDDEYGEPLLDELVEAIDRIEPPEHLAGFWDRLETSRSTQGSASRPVVMVEVALPPPPSPVEPVKRRAEVDRRRPVPRRSRGIALRAAAIVAVSGAGIGVLASQQSEPDEDSATPVSIVEPQPPESIGDSSASSSLEVQADSRPEPATTTTDKPNAEPPKPTTSEVEVPTVEPAAFDIASMNKPFAGGWSENGWRMYGDSYIESPANFSGGDYVIEVEARGYSAGTFRPKMEVRVGDQLVGSVRVELGKTKRYTFSATVPSGVQNVQIAFTNDPNRPELDVDLEIRALAISADERGPATR